MKNNFLRIMKHIFLICFFLLTTIFASDKPDLSILNPEQSNQKITINNAILAKVNGKTISVLDVAKKMDLIFHQMYPDLANSKSAKFQFYNASWKHVLNEMINTHLMVAEAQSKEVKINDGEIREEMEQRFGPNILVTLENIGVSYNEAWEMTKTEMIVKRMMWYFVHAKALTKITPETIRQNYRIYCQKNPPLDEWEYQVISIKSTNQKLEEELSKKAYELAKNTPDFTVLQDKLKDFEKLHPDCTLQVSATFKRNSKELASSHKDVLSALKEDSYSLPIAQLSKVDNQKTHKIFYLKKHDLKTAPTFDDLSLKIKDELLQKVVTEESQAYFTKLRKFYGFDENSLKKIIPQDFQPFSLQ